MDECADLHPEWAAIMWLWDLLKDAMPEFQNPIEGASVSHSSACYRAVFHLIRCCGVGAQTKFLVPIEQVLTVWMYYVDKSEDGQKSLKDVLKAERPRIMAVQDHLPLHAIMEFQTPETFYDMRALRSLLSTMLDGLKDDDEAISEGTHRYDLTAAYNVVSEACYMLNLSRRYDQARSD